MKATTQLIETADFRTEITRQGEGPTLVMIMGGGTGKDAWNAMVSELAPLGVSCVTYDNRGTGEASDVIEGMRIEDMARDGAALIEALGEGPVHVAGVSMGGFIAMRLASMRPDLIRTLTLHATAARPSARTIGTGDFRRQILESGLPDAPGLVRSHLRLWAASSTGLRIELPKDVVSHSEAFNKENYLGHLAAVRQHHMTAEDLAAITAPTLITSGTEDLLTTLDDARVLNAGIPGSKLVTIDRAGHIFYIEDAALTAALQFGWIAKHS